MGGVLTARMESPSRRTCRSGNWQAHWRRCRQRPSWDRQPCERNVPSSLGSCARATAEQRRGRNSKKLSMRTHAASHEDARYSSCSQSQLVRHSLGFCPTALPSSRWVVRGRHPAEPILDPPLSADPRVSEMPPRPSSEGSWRLIHTVMPAYNRARYRRSASPGSGCPGKGPASSLLGTTHQALRMGVSDNFWLKVTQCCPRGVTANVTSVAVRLDQLHPRSREHHLLL